MCERKRDRESKEKERGRAKRKRERKVSTNEAKKKKKKTSGHKTRPRIHTHAFTIENKNNRAHVVIVACPLEVAGGKGNLIGPGVGDEEKDGAVGKLITANDGLCQAEGEHNVLALVNHLFRWCHNEPCRRHRRCSPNQPISPPPIQCTHTVVLFKTEERMCEWVNQTHKQTTNKQ